jgi:hypothetical protein
MPVKYHYRNHSGAGVWASFDLEPVLRIPHPLNFKLEMAQAALSQTFWRESDKSRGFENRVPE